MNYYQNVLYEAVFVGVLLIALGLGIYHLDKYLNFRKKYTNINIELSLYLFLIGMLTHIIYEALGANKWYCKHGASCKLKN